MADKRHARGLLDTSGVIDLELIDPRELPIELAVSAGSRKARGRRDPDDFEDLSDILHIVAV